MPNSAILSELEEVYGKDAISPESVEKWTAAFDGGRTEIVDLPRFGRPYDTGKVKAASVLIKDEGHLSQKKIGKILGIHQETVNGTLCDDLSMAR
jgi:hypothetical protein